MRRNIFPSLLLENKTKEPQILMIYVTNRLITILYISSRLLLHVLLGFEKAVTPAST